MRTEWQMHAAVNGVKVQLDEMFPDEDLDDDLPTDDRTSEISRQHLERLRIAAEEKARG
jgi:hypothetical protein